MPGAGKSTVGVVLAKKLGMKFIDSDLMIQEKKGMLLNEIIDQKGLQAFINIEEEVNSSIDVENCVIATGGSVIYGENAMQHFRKIGEIIYLSIELETLSLRLGDLKERGVVLKEGQDLQGLFEERVPLYERYATKSIECAAKSIYEIVDEISDVVSIDYV